MGRRSRLRERASPSASGATFGTTPNADHPEVMPPPRDVSDPIEATIGRVMAAATDPERIAAERRRAANFARRRPAEAELLNRVIGANLVMLRQCDGWTRRLRELKAKARLTFAPRGMPATSR